MAAGLLAAHYWHKASKPVEVAGVFDVTGDPAFARMGENSAILGSITEAAKWNALGARWAAVAALLGGAATLVGSFT